MAAIPHLGGLGVLTPPYEDVQPIRSLDDSALAIPRPGTFLVLDFPERVPSAKQLATFVPDLRRRYPVIPVIFRLNPDEAGLHAARQAGMVGVRAVLTFEERPREVLRGLVARPAVLGKDVIEWLEVVGVGIPPEIRPFLERVLSRPLRRGELAAVLEEAGSSPAAVRQLCKRASLPTPEAWRRLGRGLGVVVELQTNLEESVGSVAERLSFADRASMYNLLTSLFGRGASAGRVRNALGWEWLLYVWKRKRLS